MARLNQAGGDVSAPTQVFLSNAASGTDGKPLMQFKVTCDAASAEPLAIHCHELFGDDPYILAAGETYESAIHITGINRILLGSEDEATDATYTDFEPLMTL